jgi:hypothetical protein
MSQIFALYVCPIHVCIYNSLSTHGGRYASLPPFCNAFHMLVCCLGLNLRMMDHAERSNTEPTLLCPRLPAHVPLRSQLTLELCSRAGNFLRDSADAIGAGPDVLAMCH